MAEINVPLEYDGHPKVVRLTGLLGKGSAYLPIKLWLYAGKYHADSGRMTAHSTQEVEAAIGWWGREGECVKALMHVDLLRQHEDGFEVMGLEGSWLDLNGHLSRLKDRAKRGAEARWNSLAPSNASVPDKQCPQEPSLATPAVKPLASKPAVVVDPKLGMPASFEFMRFFDAYPRKFKQAKAAQAWSELAPDAALQARIAASLEQHKRLKSWVEAMAPGGDLQFIPYAETWLTERRWEDDLSGEQFSTPPKSNELPKCGRKTCSIKQHKQRPSPLDGTPVCDQCWDVELVQAEDKA